VTAGGRKELPDVGAYVPCVEIENNPFGLWQSNRARD
jgi:hypothetical protein